jgi:hypothetical protein
MGPCHHSMAYPQVVGGDDSLQIWMVPVTVLNKQSQTADKPCNICLEAFVVTKFNKILFGAVLCNCTVQLQVISRTLKVGTESVPETLEECHTLTQLPAREDFIEAM